MSTSKDSRPEPYHPHGGHSTRRWTGPEIETLMELWGLESPKVVSLRVGRSVFGCLVKAKRLGINRRMAWWSARQVGDLFGVDSHKVVDLWVKQGLLKGRRIPHLGAGRTYRIWGFHAEDIEKFIWHYPWAYDWRRMQEGWEKKFAHAAWDADPWLTLAQVAKMLGVSRGCLKRHLLKGWLKGRNTSWAGPGQGQRGWLIQQSELGRFKKWPHRQGEDFRRHCSEGQRRRHERERLRQAVL